MKLATKTGMMILAIGMVFFFTGCVVEDSSSPDCYSDCCYDNCGYINPPPPIEEWVALGDWNTLEVGGYCCSSGCDDTCGYSDEVASYDTLYLDGYYDYNLVDLRVQYDLINWSGKTVSTWVTLCDDYGCEDVWYDNIYPYEEIRDWAYNPVLDSAMSDFDDCVYLFGDGCTFDYWIDVYLGEECTCADITVDYYYEGLYVY